MTRVPYLFNLVMCIQLSYKEFKRARLLKTVTIRKSSSAHIYTWQPQAYPEAGYEEKNNISSTSAQP
jgi:hypothetical protein